MDSRAYEDLLHRVAVEGIDAPALTTAVAALCADAVRSGASRTLIGVLCDPATPAVARERALARAVGVVRAAAAVPVSTGRPAPRLERAGWAALV